MTAPDHNAFSLDINDPEDAELIEYFLGELPTRVDAILTAFTTDDYEGLGRIAHQLKGAAPGFGFPGIGTEAAKLEQQLSLASNPSDEIESLRSQVENLVSLCNSYMNPS